MTVQEAIKEPYFRTQDKLWFWKYGAFVPVDISTKG